MGLQPGVSRKGGGIHYGSGGCNVQMARCYGGTCPTLQQSQLSSPAHLSPPLALSWVVTQGWSSGEKRRAGDVSLTRFKVTRVRQFIGKSGGGIYYETACTEMFLHLRSVNRSVRQERQLDKCKTSPPTVTLRLELPEAW